MGIGLSRNCCLCCLARTTCGLEATVTAHGWRISHPTEAQTLTFDWLRNIGAISCQAIVKALQHPGMANKDMVCFDCLSKISATIAQAKRHGWEVWVGGARCASCLDHPIKMVPTKQLAEDPGIELEQRPDYPRYFKYPGIRRTTPGTETI